MKSDTLLRTIALLALPCGAMNAAAQVRDCNDFADAAPAGMTLSTERIAGGSVRPGGIDAGPLLVEHCRVEGRMAERTGVDGKPYHIGFELRLPTDWNGRLLYQGGGGNDGIIRPAVGGLAAPGYALNRGFAVVSTDAGHQGASADFGFDPLARIDHAYNAHDRVAVAAKALVQQFYGLPAEHSYFIGCSGGGRQGMMFTQRFPSYFDGVIAVAPAMRVSKGATIAAAWDTQQLHSIAPPDADGNPILSRALTDADLGVLRQGILDACDADDGLADGLVSNPAACTFDVRSLTCADGEADACLAPPQVAALEKMFAGPRDSAGNALYSSWPWDPGIGHPRNDWRTWRLGTSPTADANSIHALLMQDALQRHFVTPPDPSLSIYEFDFDADPARMDANDWITGTADDAVLAPFRAAGGKLLLAHGLADPIFSPHDTIDYYERLSREHGSEATDFSRLFLIPGMSHCQGGAATDSWDGLAAIVDWVENDRAPDRIDARGTTVFPDLARPLCPYPEYARYDGSGDPDSAASFVCTSPDPAAANRTALAGTALVGSALAGATTDPESRSRLPLLTRTDMPDAQSARIYDALAGPGGKPPRGTLGIALYSPATAAALGRIDEYLRLESELGPRLGELLSLITAREMNLAYEWSLHEPAALRAGLEPAVIEAIRLNEPVDGLASDDALIIGFGRELFRHRHVDPATFATLVERLGRQRAFDAIMQLTVHAMGGIMQRAVDQRPPAGWDPDDLPGVAGVGTPAGRPGEFVAIGPRPPLPGDVHEDSLYRFALLRRDELDRRARRIFDQYVGTDRETTPRGPVGMTFLSPELVEPVQQINTALRVEGALDRRIAEIVVTATGREMNSQYQWIVHGAAARDAGAEPQVLDAIGNDGDLADLDQRDAVAIAFTRELFREETVRPETFDSAVAIFGTRGTVEMAALIGDYLMMTTVYNALGMRLRPEQEPTLPHRAGAPIGAEWR